MPESPLTPPTGTPVDEDTGPKPMVQREIRHEVLRAEATAALEYPTERAVVEKRIFELQDQAQRQFKPVGDVSAAANARPERNNVTNVEYMGLMNQLLGLGLYNTHYDSKTRKPEYHLDLKGAPEIEDKLKASLKELASRGLIRVVTPFVKELTARINVAYNANLVGAENIIAIESGTQVPTNQDQRWRAIAQVQQERVPVLDQTDIIKKIPWRYLKEQGVFRKPEPYEGETDEVFAQRYEQEMDEAPEGSKGLTMFASALNFYARDKHARQIKDQGGKPDADYNPHDILDDDTIIMFHDTDIGNPTIYDATTHAVGFPVTFPPEGKPFISGMTARLGEGRNNEAIAGQANVMAKFGRTVLERRLGLALQTVVWHLTGERWIRWGELKRMPFAPKMGIESFINFYCASRTIEEGYELRAQVPVVERKREYDPVTGQDEESYPDREFDMIYMLQQFYAALGIYTSETGKLPSQWDIDDISVFNVTYGGQFVFNTVNGPLSGTREERKVVSTKEPKVKRLDPLIPSCNMLDDMGLLDIQNIAGVSPHAPVIL